MTAIVLAGGRGQRLKDSAISTLATSAQRRAATRGLKVLMPVGPGHRPLVDYVLARLAEAGCTDVVLVVPPDHGALAAHLAANPPAGLRLRLAVQPVANGTAGAVAAAAPLVAGAGVPGRERRQPLSACRRCVRSSRSTAAAWPRSRARRSSARAASPPSAWRHSPASNAMPRAG